MLERITIYLSGSVVKGKKEDEQNTALWDEKEINIIEKLLSPTNVNFLNPSERKDDLSNSKSVVGRDLMQVLFSDVIIVDAREKRGIGVGAEMLFAKQNSIPVVTIVPKESHYRKDNFVLLGQPITSWIHPFVENLSDYVASSAEEAVEWIKEHIVLKNDISIKNNKYLYESIEHYLEAQLAKDTPMQEMFDKDPCLLKKKQNFLKQCKENTNSINKSTSFSQGFFSFSPNLENPNKQISTQINVDNKIGNTPSKSNI